MQDFKPQLSTRDGETRRLSPDSEEVQKELQLMQDTHLLLRNMAEREKATLKTILDGLYEVGSARLINKEVSISALRGPLKKIAHFSKPVFRLFAWRWVKRNCPELVTNWLYTQARFGERSLLLEAVEDNIQPIDVLPSREPLPLMGDTEAEEPETLSPIVEKQAEEILLLRTRITRLSIALLVLSGVVCLKIFV
ncbi:MAG: hypothetical protein ACFBSG_01625 [Leptolyngbyaceae cyanobacterium]